MSLIPSTLIVTARILYIRHEYAHTSSSVVLAELTQWIEVAKILPTFEVNMLFKYYVIETREKRKLI